MDKEISYKVMPDPKHMLLELHNVTKRFPLQKGFFGEAKEFVDAVNGVSFSIENGETLGLVGESGCGKSTLGRIILGLVKPTSGQILFNGKPEIFRREMQIIFQDPFSSLNPRMSVGDIILEPLLVHGLCPKKEKEKLAAELLLSVHLDPNSIYKYPHEFSGGQRQRISIARAIALKPKFIVADEPVSSLDVAIQAEILDLLKELKLKYSMSYLFISHDLRTVANICDRVAVMYQGKIVEILQASQIKSATHTYTQKLLSAIPIADPTLRKKKLV